MANTRPTQIKPRPDPGRIAASARYWVKITGAWDATTSQNGIPCDGVAVDTEGAQLTGIPGGQIVGTTPVQAQPMSVGVMYPISFYTITALGTAGNVWLYWLEDPAV